MNVIRNFGGVPNGSVSANQSQPSCHPAHTTEAVVLFTLAGLGMGANLLLMSLILIKRPLRRWSQGLLFHQGLVDCARASLLVPLGISVIVCQRFPKCSSLETVFLLLVTVSTVNMLTSVINDAPLLPDHPGESGAGGGGRSGGHHQHRNNPPPPPPPHHHYGAHHHHRAHHNEDYADSEEEEEMVARRGMVPRSAHSAAGRGRRGSYASSFSSSTTTSGGRSRRSGAGASASNNNGGNLLDSPQCIVFGLFIIWFASVTINLGPTFLSGALTSSSGGIYAAHHVDACPMVVAPVRHYVLNALWVTVNLLCVALTAIHLRKLYRDLSRSNLEAVRIAGMVTTMIAVSTEPRRGGPDGRGGACCDRHRAACYENSPGYQQHHHIHNYIHRLEREGIRRVKMFVIILVAYVLFWGPLYTLTLIHPAVVSMTSGALSGEAAGKGGGVDGATLTYEVTLHVAFVHAFVNPTLLLVLHRDLREAAGDLARCKNWSSNERGDGGPPYESAVDAPPYCSSSSLPVSRAGSLGRGVRVHGGGGDQSYQQYPHHGHHGAFERGGEPMGAGEEEEEEEEERGSAFGGSYHSLAFRGGYM